MPERRSNANSITMQRVAAFLLLAGLAACQGTPQPPSSIGAPVSPVSNSAPSTQPGEITFAFEPFTGAPGNVADELSELIGREAREQGITLVRRIGASATYRVNGFLSATGQPSTGTVFYVFDIVDGSGRRLKRVSGTEDTGGTSGDPWKSVSTGTLSRIANRSLVEIKAWLNR